MHPLPPPVRIWPIAREPPPPPPPPPATGLFTFRRLCYAPTRAHRNVTGYCIKFLVLDKISYLDLIIELLHYQEIAAPDTQKVCFLDARALPTVGSARAHASCVWVGGGAAAPPKAMLDPPLMVLCLLIGCSLFEAPETKSNHKHRYPHEE